MTTLTITTILIILFGVSGPSRYGFALALGGVTASGAAVFVGGIAVPTFYAVALGLIPIMLLGALRTRKALTLPPGVGFLWLALSIGIVVTVVAPFLFRGTQTVTPDHSVLAPGVITSSNLAQVIYLALGILVVQYLARQPSLGPQLIGLIVGASTLLSLWRYGSITFGLPFPVGFFDNSPGFVYQEVFAGGAKRFRGIFSEPSALAGSCLVMISYGLSRARQLRGMARISVLAVSAVAIYLGVASTATTFLVAGVVIAAIFGTASLFGLLGRSTRLSPLLAIVACLLVFAAVLVLPVVADFIESAISEKTGGASFSERSSADSLSYGVFVETWGFGVGLGSGRASSFVPTILSTVGLFGTLAFVGAIVSLIWRCSGNLRARPVIWALVALMVTKCVAGPDLSDTSGVLWVSLGLLSNFVLHTDKTEFPLSTRIQSEAWRLNSEFGI